MSVPQEVRDWWATAVEGDPNSTDSVCDYLYEYTYGLDGHTCKVCHASMGHDSVRDRFAFSTSLRRGTGSKSASYAEVPADYARDFWEYIFHPKISPYRLALTGDVQWIWGDGPEPIAIRLTDMHVPSQVLGALCITSRHPLEAEPHVQFYGWLREKGFTQADAFFFSIYLGWLGNDRKRVGIPTIHNTNHYSFDRGVSADYWKVVDGKPAYTKGFFDKSPSYAGVFYLFNGGDYRNNILEIKSSKPKQAVRVYNGLFPDKWAQYQAHLNEALLQDQKDVGTREDVYNHCLALKDKWNDGKAS